MTINLGAVQTAMEKIQTYLGDSGLADIGVSKGDVTNVSKVLDSLLSSEDYSAVIKQIDKDTLIKLIHEIGASSKIPGFGGLSQAKMDSLFTKMATSLNDNDRLVQIGKWVSETGSKKEIESFTNALNTARAALTPEGVSFNKGTRYASGFEQFDVDYENNRIDGHDTYRDLSSAAFDRTYVNYYGTMLRSQFDANIPQQADIQSGLAKLLGSRNQPGAYSVTRSTSNGHNVWTVQLNSVDDLEPDNLDTANLVKIRQTDVGNASQIVVAAGNSDVTLNLQDSDEVKIIGNEHKQNIYIDQSVKTDLWIDTGEGDDSILNYGLGTNTITGGGGNDVMYGGKGNNVFHDSAGNNYFSAGQGSNKIQAGGEHSIVSAVMGHSEIQNFADSATIYTGNTDSTIEDQGATTAKVYHTFDGSLGLGHSITKIEGNDEFQQRVLADIVQLQSSPNGQKMLKEYDKIHATKGHQAIIAGFDSRYQNAAAGPLNPEAASQLGLQPINPKEAYLHPDGTPGKGTDIVLFLNGFLNIQGLSPFLAEFHESAHGFTHLAGTTQPDQVREDGLEHGQNIETGEYTNPAEPQVMGYENTGIKYDYDGSGPGKASTHLPVWLTEKGISEELGIPVRKYHNIINPPMEPYNPQG